MKKLKVIIIGCGGRGSQYAHHMLTVPEKYEIVAIADPVEGRRKTMQQMCSLPDEMLFHGWEDVLSVPKFADVVVICTVDNMHYAPAMKAIELGYHILLEKPVAPTPQECAEIALAAEEKGVSVLVCHVLRYSFFYKTLKKLLLKGVIGDVISVSAVEGVGAIHQSHSFIRGNWHSEKESAPMLLAKSCHDMDILQWLLDKPCKKVTSFGNLTHFRKENAPEGAPVRCADGGCPVGDTCPYNCIKLYYDDKDNAWFRRSATRAFAKTGKPTDEEVMHALKTTDYGLCVYQANNDVVDHQVVNMEFEGDITVQFTMTAFAKGGRYIRIYGTTGELSAYGDSETITLFNHADKTTTMIPVDKPNEITMHGGGDLGIVNELYDYLSGTYTGYCAADISRSVKNHMLVFAAEKARHNNTVESLDEYMNSFGLVND
jgi:predicted dehydrogenase